MNIFRQMGIAIMAILLYVSQASAQKAMTTVCNRPAELPPVHGDYANYRTYEDLLLISRPELAQQWAAYSWPQRNFVLQAGTLQLQAADADFRILFRLDDARVVNAMPAGWEVEVALNAMVYDKAGDACWNSDRQEISADYSEQAGRMGAPGSLAMNQAQQNTRMAAPGVFRLVVPRTQQVLTPDDAVREAVYRCMDAVLIPFTVKYLGSTGMTYCPFMGFYTSFRGSGDYTAVTNAIARIDTVALKTASPAAWKRYVLSLEPMMQRYSTITGIRNEEHFRKMGNYNLAIICLLKGDTVQADAFMEKAAAIDVGSYENRNSLKQYEDAKAMMTAPAAAPYGTSIHPGNMRPAYTVDELLLRNYSLLFRGTAYLKNGATKKGLFLPQGFGASSASLNPDGSRISQKKAGKTTLLNIYESIGGPLIDTVRMASIDHIEEAGGATVVMYNAGKGSEEVWHFFRTVYHSPKIKIFRQLYPEPDFEAFYLLRPGDRELWASPLLLTKKTLIKYFDNCAPMKEALEKNQVSYLALPALGKYYTTYCN